MALRRTPGRRGRWPSLLRRMRWLSLPLRWRLVAVTLVGAVGFAVGFAALATWEVDRLENRALNSSLQTRLDAISEDVSAAGNLAIRSEPPRTTLVQIIGPGGVVRDATSTLRGQPPLVSLKDVLASPDGVRRTLGLGHTRLTVLAVPQHVDASAAGPGGEGALVVGIDSEAFVLAGDQLREILVYGLAVLVPLAGVLAWLLAGGALRTVTRLTEEAEAVGVSDVGTGLAVPTRDPELARLVGALNRMLARVAAGLEQERRFAADASHRLRTPLATLRAEAELALIEGEPGGMKEALGHVISDADDLTDLVNRLLAAHRRSGGEQRMLGEALTDASDRWRRQVQAAGLTFEYDDAAATGSADEPPVDPHLFRAVVDPLVENAAQHTDTGGVVRVGVGLRPGADAPVLIVDVWNSGRGVAEDMQDRLFRPWATTRAERGGAGLGLWLAREAARARAGDVTLVDPRPGATMFRATLPLA